MAGPSTKQLVYIETMAEALGKEPARLWWEACEAGRTRHPATNEGRLLRGANSYETLTSKDAVRLTAILRKRCYRQLGHCELHEAYYQRLEALE